MSHPRATFPPDVIAYYQANGQRGTCSAYRTSWRTLRRWLIERGVVIRPWGKQIARAVAALALLATIAAEDMPAWILPGILATETRSHYRADGSIAYVDKRRGSHGERGPFQCTAVAFRQVRQGGEQFWRVEVDRTFAESIAVRYLWWLRERSPSWERAVEAYNGGPGRRSPSYLAAVLAAGGGL
jgi:hypothetical protein